MFTSYNLLFGPTVLACVAGKIGDRVRVLCLWRMAERGNRGAASELGRSRIEIKAGKAACGERGNRGAARELGRSRVERNADEARVLVRRSRDPQAAQPRMQLDSSPIPSRLRGSLSLPFAINKAHALGRQSRQLRRLRRYRTVNRTCFTPDLRPIPKN